MSSDPTLQSFFDAPGAPAQDARFRLAVMERVARRRFVLNLAIEFALFVAAASCLWMLAPTLGPRLIALGQSHTEVPLTLVLVALGAFAGRWILGFGGTRRRA